jgi:hypothetical protein
VGLFGAVFFAGIIFVADAFLLGAFLEIAFLAERFLADGFLAAGFLAGLRAVVFRLVLRSQSMRKRRTGSCFAQPLAPLPLPKSL